MFFCTGESPVFKKNVIVVGTGPSLDSIDLKNIKNSSVVLLNNAWQVASDIDDSNDIYSLISDYTTLNRITNLIPRDLRRIVIFDRTRISFKILKSIWLHENKFFIYKVPYSFVCNLRSIIGIANIRSGHCEFSSGAFCTVASKLNNFKINYEKIDTLWYAPYTVMFSAVYCSYIFGGVTIVSLGFDETFGDFNNNASTNISLPSGYYGVSINDEAPNIKLLKHNQWFNSISSRPNRRIVGVNIWTKHLFLYLTNKDVVWLNCSPKTKVATLPNIPPDQFYRLIR